MIYIRRDESLIPQKVIDVALRAQDELEHLPPEQRKEFIKKKSHIWRGFAKYLIKMSYGKCWYSESKDVGANFDIDHFRPKSEAKRSEEIIDEGYAWLAFDWNNFRLSAQNCNRLNIDEEADKTVGKGSWFPLLPHGAKATWTDRCIDEEKGVLLDPTIESDLVYIDYDETGRLVPSRLCVGEPALRVRTSAVIYGLNLERMREARSHAMKDAKELLETILQSAEDLNPIGDDAPMRSIERQMEQLKEKTRADAPFSRAVRTQLVKLGAEDYLIDRSMDAA